MNSVVNIVLLITLGLQAGNSASHCRSPQFEPYQRFASRTHSNVVSNMNSNQLSYAGCKAKQIWMLLRHSSRYPNRDVIETMEATLPQLHRQIMENIDSTKATLCQDDADLLRGWEWRYNVDISGQLMDSGVEEMQKMAERFKDRFPELLDVEFSNETFLLRHTATQRTEKSAHAFSEGLFNKVVDMPQAVKNDPLIRFYKNCQRWLMEIASNNDSLREQYLFRQGTRMAQLVGNVSQRLGFNKSLDYEKIQVMFDACRSEKAERHVLPSPWCVVFTDEEFKTLEYYEDLAYYWRESYGNALNYESACPLVRDWMDNFRAAIAGTSQKRGIFYFSHDGAIVKFLTALGLFNDSYKLQHDNYDPTRKFKSSDVVPFSSNVAFVLLDCNTTHKVMTFVQEKPETTQSILWNDMETKYGKTADGCNFALLCGNSAALLCHSPLLYIGILLIFLSQRHPFRI